MRFLFVLASFYLLVASSEKSLEGKLLRADKGHALLSIDGQGLPIAVLHGMGDSCFNQGMVSLTNEVESALGGLFTKCIPLGDTQDEDSSSYFSLTMTEQVDEFARRVKEIAEYQDGFRVFGISQGALITRGYVQRYSWRDDYPTVVALIALHGPMMGVGKLPLCSPTDGAIGSFCNTLNSISGQAAYRPFLQNTLAQSNYYRHPCILDSYLETEYLPPLNLEASPNQNVGEVRGLENLGQLVLVKADEENVIFPSESCWFGIYEDNGCDFKNIQTMKETSYYEDDVFGLRTLDESGRLFFETTPRGHVEISTEELRNLVQKYWL